MKIRHLLLVLPMLFCACNENKPQENLINIDLTGIIGNDARNSLPIGNNLTMMKIRF